MWVGRGDARDLAGEDLRQGGGRFFATPLPVPPAVRMNYLAHLVPHAPHWVKCDPGLLKDQRDLRATNFFQFALAAGDQLAPGELNRPANNLAPRRQQAQERQRGGRLSAEIGRASCRERV